MIYNCTEQTIKCVSCNSSPPVPFPSFLNGGWQVAMYGIKQKVIDFYPFSVYRQLYTSVMHNAIYYLRLSYHQQLQII